MPHFPLTLSATLFFVLGQVLIKKSTTSSLHTAYLFSISIGLFGLIGLILSSTIFKPTALNSKSSSGSTLTLLAPILAGALFFFGNLLWIQAIHLAPNISHVRIVMAGLETALLALVAYYLFHQSVTQTQLVGMALIVCGIVLVAHR